MGINTFIQRLPTVKIIKAVDQTAPQNDTTLIDDDDFSADFSKFKSYMFVLVLYINTSAVADIDITIKAITNALIERFGKVNEGITQFGTELRIAGTGADEAHYIYGSVRMGTSNGTFQIQWAQGNAELSDTKLLSGSFLTIWESN